MDNIESTDISKPALNILLSSPYLNEGQKVSIIKYKDSIEKVLQCNSSTSVSENHFQQILDIPLVHNELSIAGLIDSVAIYFEINYEDIIGKSRKVNIVNARQISMFLAVTNRIDKSYTDIARYFKTDHANIIHGYKKVKSKIDHDLAVIDDLLHLAVREDYVKV